MTNVEKVNELKREFKANILQFFQMTIFIKVKLNNPFGVRIIDTDMFGDPFLIEENVTHIDQNGQIYFEFDESTRDILDLDVGDIAYILDDLLTIDFPKEDVKHSDNLDI